MSYVGLQMMPAFDVDTGHLPVGRYSCTPDQAQDLLVTHDQFANSTTRADLWVMLERYLTKFFRLEETYASELPGPLLDRFWLGGSFVSAKLDPRNVDVTLLINDEAKSALKGKEGVGIFARTRESVLEEFKVSPLFLNYRPVVNVFRLDELEETDKAYLARRGAWDDWWQRTRQDGEKQAPSLETCAPRRGYLEVVL